MQTVSIYFLLVFGLTLSNLSSASLSQEDDQITSLSKSDSLAQENPIEKDWKMRLKYAFGGASQLGQGTVNTATNTALGTLGFSETLLGVSLVAYGSSSGAYYGAKKALGHYEEEDSKMFKIALDRSKVWISSGFKRIKTGIENMKYSISNIPHTIRFFIRGISSLYKSVQL